VGRWGQSATDDDDDNDDVSVTSLVEMVPPKVERCPSQSASGRRLVYTTSEMTAIVPKPPVSFLSADGLRTLPHTCSHYGNASSSTNHSFALGTHRILCTARDRRSNAVAHCAFDIHVIGTVPIFSFFTCLYFLIFFNFENKPLCLGCIRRALRSLTLHRMADLLVNFKNSWY